MYGIWQEYINDFKLIAGAAGYPRDHQRLSVLEEEIEAFWDSRNLVEMEQIFTISCSYVINFMFNHLLTPYINSRRTTTDAYTLSLLDEHHQEQVAMYIYDCKLFRANIYSREENDFISSLNLVYRGDLPLQENPYEVAHIGNVGVGQWQVKVKESCLLRVFGYLRELLRRVRHRQDKVVMGQPYYDKFVEEWMKCYYNYNLEITAGFFFRALLAILDNQLLRHYLFSLTPQQIAQRQHSRPIKTIDKPRNVEQFTLTEGTTETETRWQSLKVTAFQLKYRIKESQEKYECFLAQEEQEPQWDFDCMNQEDRKIWEAFDKMRKNQQEYEDSYC